MSPEAKRAYDRKRYAENREAKIAQSRAYYKKNRPARLAYIRDYSAKKQAEKREHVMKLKEQPCMDCGQCYHFAAMDFDHRGEDEKKGSITDMMRNMRVTLKRLVEEIAKCDLVCANCHRVRTYNRMLENENVEAG
jgi:hypothetical protein